MFFLARGIFQRCACGAVLAKCRKKAIVYTQIGVNLFNLGFGDWNEAKQTLDDSNRSNNGDRGGSFLCLGGIMRRF